MAVPSAPDAAERAGVVRRDLLAQPPDVERRLEEMTDGGEALAPVRRREIGVDPVEHLLRRREVPGGLEHEQPILRRPEHVQLPVRADVVEPGVRPRVGQEHEALVEPHGEAVRHGGRV